MDEGSRGQQSTESDRSGESTQWANARVAVSLPCRRCMYDLRGLSIESRCPECGLEVLTTVHASVDPAASNLPRLRDPAGVGNGLFWLIAAMLGAAFVLAVHAIVHRMPGIQDLAMLRIGPLGVHELVFLAGLLLLSGLWSTWRFRSPRGTETEARVRRDVRLLAVALAVAGCALLLLWHRERMWAAMGWRATADEVVRLRSWYHLAVSAAAIIALWAVRGVLETIGRRSREYRRARGGRQSIGPMTAAVIGAAIGLVLRILSIQWPALDRLWTFGTILVWICGFMILIGLAYLLVNAWWIRHALRRPPPRLESLLAIPSLDGGERVVGDDQPQTDYFR